MRFDPALPLEQIVECPRNPRRHFDQVKLEELAQSVREKGIVQPLLVRPLVGEEGRKSFYEVVFGARRYRAAKLAGLDAAPCTVRNLTDSEAYEIMSIENLQREDMSPAEEAEAYSVFRSEYNYSVEMIAQKVGKSPSYIYQRLRLAEVHPSVQADLNAGHLPLRYALAIARLPSHHQPKALALAYQYQKHLNTFANFVFNLEREFFLSLSDSAFSKTSETLVPEAGSCRMCPKRTGANPLLFDDVGKKDTCTDAKCFNEKLDAHLAEQRKKLSAKGPLIQITERYNGGDKKKNILPTNAFRDATDDSPADQVVTAIVCEGRERGKLKRVLLKPEAHTWMAASEEPKQPKRQADDDAAVQKKKIEFLTALRFQLFRDISASLPEDLFSSWYISFLIRHTDREVSSPAALAALREELHLAKPKKPTEYLPDDFFSAELNPNSLIRRALLATAAVDLEAKTWNIHADLTGEMQELCAYLEIDIKAAKTAVRDQLKAAAKESKESKSKRKGADAKAAPEAEPNAEGANTEPAVEPERKKRGRPRKVVPPVEAQPEGAHA